MTRAIIEGKVDDFHYRVRIPILNKINSSVGATPTDELAIATISAVPGISPKFRSGDIVFVEFEERDTSKPVIVGRLFNTLDSKIVSDARFDSLIVDVNTNLSNDTSIGEVTAENIRNLEQSSSNIQYEINRNKKQHIDIETNITDIQSDITNINGSIEQINSSISNIESDIDTIELDINSINQDINQIQEKNDAQDQELESIQNNISEIQSKINGPLILNNISYGTADPSTILNPEEGQIYLYIQ